MLFRVLLVGLVLHYLLIPLRSPWRIWGWYHYPLIPTAMLALPVYLYVVERRFRIRWSLYCILCLCSLSIFGIFRFLKDRHEKDFILAAAELVAGFEKKHPGIYAMGDCAGKTAFLLSSPVIQTEGLVSGKKILGMIRREVSLCDFFEELSVDYYITIDPIRNWNGCYRVSEPNAPSDNAPKMRGELCFEPDYKSPIPNSEKELFIFSISKAGERCLRG